MDLVLCDGTTQTLTPDDPTTKEAFWATVGGMGLTGVVTTATIRMLPIRTSRMRVDTDRFTSLDELMARMTEADADYRYTVAWVDSVSGRSDFRSVLTCGDHAELDDLPERDQRDPLAYDPRTRASAPPWFPRRTLNRWSVAAFNEVWFRKAPQRRRDELHSIADFFHPLDMVEHWNRVYGPQGFLQYQFSVPEQGSAMIRTALERLRSAQAPSFLTVLKRFGPSNPAPLSFPSTGWTLALDLSAAVPGLAGVLDDLDDQVLAAGGRLYLAKDSRMAPAAFRAGYPRFDEWLQTVRRLDPDGVFTSDQFRRLVP
jgi:decaprenylphospho-beta-D-ribofuranose 2-oxidase